jgi:hypothetical protein
MSTGRAYRSRKDETDMQNKGSVQDKTDNTPKPSPIGASFVHAASAASAPVTPVQGKPAKKRAKYNILPARYNTPIKADGSQIIATRTHVGQTVCVATCVLLPDNDDIELKPGTKVETDHRNGSHAPCGTWTVLDKSDKQYVIGQNVRVNYIAVNN